MEMDTSGDGFISFDEVRERERERERENYSTNQSLLRNVHTEIIVPINPLLRNVHTEKRQIIHTIA